MDERGGELDFHALAKAEVAHRLVQQRLELQQVHQLFERAFVALLREAEDFLEHAVFAFPGDGAEHSGGAARGVQQPAQHFEGSGLAGPVGAEEPDDLASAKLERHVVDGLDLGEAPTKDRAQRGCHALFTLVDAEGLAQVVDGDRLAGWHAIRRGVWNVSHARCGHAPHARRGGARGACGHRVGAERGDCGLSGRSDVRRSHALWRGAPTRRGHGAVSPARPLSVRRRRVSTAVLCRFGGAAAHGLRELRARPASWRWRQRWAAAHWSA